MRMATSRTVAPRSVGHGSLTIWVIFVEIVRAPNISGEVTEKHGAAVEDAEKLEYSF